MHVVLAHRQAWELCNYVHRDVSAKNILVDANGRGILNDWDLAKKKSELDRRRRHERTGTWEFMSSLVLASRKKGTFRVHTIQDDMESFVHVLLYHGLRYFPHNKPDDTLQIIKDVFQYSAVNVKGVVSGGDTKRSMFISRVHIGADFTFTTNPLQRWFAHVFVAFKQWLEFADPLPDMLGLFDGTPPPAPEIDTSNPPSHIRLKDHEFMAALFKTVLDSTEWPASDDAPSDCVPELRHESAIFASRRLHNSSLPTSSKRSSSAMASDAGGSNVRSSDGPIKKRKAYGTALSTHTMTRRSVGGGSSLGRTK
ncbi:hypothetical protein DXG03_004131 [Asterophora parasitica]|uniref:Protein kinase domain-containing protein n=1 Tax=Asterophora parasitica TaxID=117018 RepID=A0A9P7G1D9_9AGAR|nr:hypothetical protein DXG03_004131 [Asterophora parasitica]